MPNGPAEAGLRPRGAGPWACRPGSPVASSACPAAAGARTSVTAPSLPPSWALRWLREACPRRRDTATPPGAPHAAFGPAAAAWRRV